MKGYKLLELLLKHQAYGRFSISWQTHIPTRDFYDDLMHEIEGEIIEELGLELDSYGNIYPEKPEGSMIYEDPIRSLLAYWKSLLDVGLDAKEIKDSPLAREYVSDLLHDLFEVIDSEGDFDFDLKELFREVAS
tara:strand:- start:4038 stop:4439 length:402 start_codon:yes stop_codon:yes gene_type:complete